MLQRNWVLQLSGVVISLWLLPSWAGENKAWRFDHSTFDASADPCSDFYQHVCGAWGKTTNIPADRTAAVWARDMAVKGNDRGLRLLLTGTDSISDPEVARLRVFFSSCMEQSPAREAAAAKVLAPLVARIDHIDSRGEFLAMWLDLQEQGVNAFLSYADEPDPGEKAAYRGTILQGSLGRRRLFYSESGENAETERARYRAHIARMLEHLGIPPARARADAHSVFRIEAKLASASLPYFDQFDPAIGEHALRPDGLTSLAPHVPWDRYLRLVGQPLDRSLNVASPDYLRTVDTLIADMPVDDLRAYLRWQFLITFAAALPVAMTEEQHRFESPSRQPPPRFELCRLETLKSLGVELSRQFSLRYIGPKARMEAKAVTEQVRSEVVKSVPEFAWLSPQARANTEQKLRLLDLKVAYPDKWPPTGEFPLSQHGFLENVMRARAFEQRRVWTRAHSSRDRESWEATVYPNEASGMAAARLVIPNGFPDQNTNSIILTAAYLGPPLFDANAPREVQYGTFGFLVGHELGHVLETHDFDAFGEPKETWNSTDIEAHDRQNSCMVEQANQYVAFDDVHLDGKKTAGENFGDFSGIYHAYAAMADELGGRASEKGDDGYTPAQRFFIAYAQQWCTAERPESAAESLRDDGHAPARYRTNAPLANMPAFARAFSCPVGSRMVRSASTRCSFWGLAFP